MTRKIRVRSSVPLRDLGPTDLESTVKSTRARLEELFQSLLGRVERFGYSKTALVASLVSVLAVISARYYYSFVTGYIVPDEAYYYNTFILDKQPIGTYREVFVSVFIFIFRDVSSVWQFFLHGFLYSVLCAIGTIVLAYKIVRRLEASDLVGGLVLVSLPLFPIFTVMAATMATEPLGLFFCLLGVYLTLRYVQGGGSVNALLSGVSFILAYKVREPYLLFAVGNLLFYLLYLVLLRKRRAVWGFLAYALPVSIYFPVPVGWQPGFNFAQPVYAILTSLLPQLLIQLTTITAPLITPTTPTTPCTPTTPTTTTTPTMLVIPPNVLNPTFSVVTPGASGHPDILQAFGIGLIFGYNPLFMVFALVSIVLGLYIFLRTKSLDRLFVFLTTLIALGSFSVSILLTIATLPGAVTGWTSTIIRAAHTSLPSFIGFGPLYQRLRPKRAVGLILIMLILGSTQVPLLASTLQRSLSREPVDRLSLDYRAPYYRLYLLAKDSGRTLVFGGVHFRGIRIYMSMLPNVVLYPVVGEDVFKGLLASGPWDTIFLYDDWVTIAVPSMIDMYPPYYGEILKSRQYPGYMLEMVWVDGESYAIKMIPTTAQSVVPPTNSPCLSVQSLMIVALDNVTRASVRIP